MNSTNDPRQTAIGGAEEAIPTEDSGSGSPHICPIAWGAACECECHDTEPAPAPAEQTAEERLLHDIFEAPTDPRDVAHIECDCVPNLGPSRCHLCSERAGHPIEWTEAHPVAAEADREAVISALRDTRCIATPRLERGFAKPVPEEAERMADAILPLIRPVPVPEAQNEEAREALGQIIWDTSRAGESTISATGANIVADAILAAGYRLSDEARAEWATEYIVFSPESILYLGDDVDEARQIAAAYTGAVIQGHMTADTEWVPVPLEGGESE